MCFYFKPLNKMASCFHAPRMNEKFLPSGENEKSAISSLPKIGEEARFTLIDTLQPGSSGTQNVPVVPQPPPCSALVPSVPQTRLVNPGLLAAGKRELQFHASLISIGGNENDRRFNVNYVYAFLFRNQLFKLWAVQIFSWES